MLKTVLYVQVRPDRFIVRRVGDAQAAGASKVKVWSGSPLSDLQVIEKLK